ncbi:MAG: oxygen-dependent coproporphyrinogen oxidase [Myxococcota bacterium]|nr:oxygen-dependent coproporphyrinogen oxidase [Myxococcota bacterium]
MKTQSKNWFRQLQGELIASYEAIERAAGSDARFELQSWERPGGGGGTMAVLRGQVFEKAGVNFSEVHGEFSEQFRTTLPGTEASAGFWASGVSVVVHPRSPQVPAVHFNTRHIITGKSWFGGGADLTPVVADDDDTALFHEALKGACDAHEVADYASYKEACDRYFFLPHRQEARGVGGIFFDALNSGDKQADFAFVQQLGRSFLDVYPRLVNAHANEPYGEPQRAAQLRKRGRYVEFNLIHDRGTRFGLETGGNTEAILMSLPPLASW